MVSALNTPVLVLVLAELAEVGSAGKIFVGGTLDLRWTDTRRTLSGVRDAVLRWLHYLVPSRVDQVVGTSHCNGHW